MTSFGLPTFDSRQCQINARQPEKEEVHGMTLFFQSTYQSQVASAGERCFKTKIGSALCQKINFSEPASVMTAWCGE
jgi:hypothetical protein